MPSWPPSAHNGDPFECPICYRIIEAGTPHSWYQHVFEDIPPYMCTHSTCMIASKPFSRRRDWAHHEKQAHRVAWPCPLHCNQNLPTVDQLQARLQSSHGQSFEHLELQQLSMAVEAGDVTPGAPYACPLCSMSSQSFRDWTKHVGHHLEQLALFAIPQALLEDICLANLMQYRFEEVQEELVSTVPNWTPGKMSPTGTETVVYFG